MRPGRETDTRVAREIFGHEVWATNKILHERTPLGKRPLRMYTKEMEWAWEVADKMRVTLIPLADNQWFAFVAGEFGWESPQAFADFLKAGDFSSCGAAIGAEPAMLICEAALRAMEKRNKSGEITESSPSAEIHQIH